jgi:ribosome assembly protein 1
MALEFESSLEAGFQIATLQGPLCAEPVQGMAYVVESLKVDETEGHDTEGMSMLFMTRSIKWLISRVAHSKKVQAKGSVISGVRDACRKGLLDWSPRLLLAMYSCDIQASSKLFIDAELRY